VIASYARSVGFFKWLYRLPGRIDRSMERTALASSVVQSEGLGGTHPSAIGVKAVLGEIEGSGSREDDFADARGESPSPGPVFRNDL
jgi:hypothetical protein